MFVAIDNIDMNPLKVAEWIDRTIDANGGVIYPRFAMEVLGKTNHFTHIKKVVNCIKENCLDENGELVQGRVLSYKDFILSCVDKREMSPQALAELEKMADVCGCRGEFDKLNGKRKWYRINDCNGISVVRSRKEFQELDGRVHIVYCDPIMAEYLDVIPDDYCTNICRKVKRMDLSACDIGRVDRIFFAKDLEVDLSNARNVPEGKDIDVSMCSSVVGLDRGGSIGLSGPSRDEFETYKRQRRYGAKDKGARERYEQELARLKRECGIKM